MGLTRRFGHQATPECCTSLDAQVRCHRECSAEQRPQQHSSKWCLRRLLRNAVRASSVRQSTRDYDNPFQSVQQLQKPQKPHTRFESSRGPSGVRKGYVEEQLHAAWSPSREASVALQSRELLQDCRSMSARFRQLACRRELGWLRSR